MLKSAAMKSLIAVACSIALAAAADDVAKRIDVPAGDLVEALQALEKQSDAELVYQAAQLKGLRTHGVSGTLSTQEAVSKLLEGTKLRVKMDEATGAILITLPSVPSDDSSNDSSTRVVILEEVIVTAQHRAENLRNVPMGITALTGETLNKSQQRSFEDYVARVPGLSLQQGTSFLPGANRLSLRGLNAGGVGSTVAVYVDDSPFGSSSAQVNGAVFASNFDPWDMQRIEVLRGPQGLFYGASSEGGLIKFVTNPPDLGAFASTVEVGGERVERGDNGWSTKGMLNMPLGDKAAFRISAYTEHLPGFVDNTLRGKRDVNDGKKNGGRASLLFSPTDDLTIRLTAFKQDLKFNGTSAVDVDNATRQPVGGDFTQRRTIEERGTYAYDNYNATVNWNMGWAYISSITTYNRSENHPLVDLSLLSFDGLGNSFTAVLSDPNNYADQSGPLPTGPVGVFLTNQAEVKQFVQEFRLQSPSSDRLEWEVGGFYTRETGQLNQPFPMFNLADGSGFGPAGYAFFHNILDSKYREWAGFGSLTYHFNPQFDVQVGARWADNEQTSSLAQRSDFFGFTAPRAPR